MSRIFSKEELVLLQYSRIIQEYPALQTAMTNYPNLQDSEMQSVSEEAREIIENDYARIVGVAMHEWHMLTDRAKYPYIDPQESAEHTKCELCGNTQCDALFPIANYDKSQILYVGSTCITKFIPESKDAVLQEEKTRKMTLRISRLNQYFPGLYKKFFEQTFAGDDRAFLVVYPLYKDAHDCYKKIRGLCNDHMDSSEERLPEINKQIEDETKRYSEFEDKINEYLAAASSNYRIPDRKTVNRLIARNKKELVGQIRRAGGITRLSLREIDEPDFLRRHFLTRIRRLAQDSSIDILNVGERNGQIGYIAQTRKDSFEVFIPHIQISTDFGQTIMENKKTKKELTLLSMCCVDDNTDIMGMIYATVKRLRYYQIVPIAFRTDPNELYFIYKGMHCKSTAETAINQNIPFFINPDKFALPYLTGSLEIKDAQVDESEWGALFNKKRDDVILFR